MLEIGAKTDRSDSPNAVRHRADQRLNKHVRSGFPLTKRVRVACVPCITIPSHDRDCRAVKFPRLVQAERARFSTIILRFLLGRRERSWGARRQQSHRQAGVTVVFVERFHVCARRCLSHSVGQPDIIMRMSRSCLAEP